MLSIGKINTLIVKEASPVGYILSTGESTKSVWNENQQDVLLPSAKSALKIGEKVDVFVYYEQDKSLVASMTAPAITLGEFKALRVAGITDAGAFFDWGLSRDLFAPKQYTHSELNVGLPAVVTLVHEAKQKKLFATSKIEQYLEDAPKHWDLKKPVELMVYAKTPLGFKVIINQRFAGLLYHNELFKAVRVGDTHQGYISKLRDDGKIDCSLQRHDSEQRKDLSTQILEDLDAHGGISSLTDKSSAEDIQTRFNVSKGAYKRAIGQLYKAKKIIISPTHIKRA